MPACDREADWRNGGGDKTTAHDGKADRRNIVRNVTALGAIGLLFNLHFRFNKNIDTLWMWTCMHFRVKLS